MDQILATEDVTESTSSADRVYWPLVDHLGTVRDLVENDGTLGEHYTYDTFGNVTTGDTSLIRYLYTSRKLDTATGLQYNRARWYDASVGRWLILDPIGFVAGEENLYSYVANRVVSRVDPSGLVDPWYDNDWSDWINPFAYLAATGDPLGEMMGTGYGAAMHFQDQWEMNHGLNNLQQQWIAEELNSLHPESLSATGAIGASANPILGTLGDTVEDTVQIGNGVVATGVLGTEVIGVLQGGAILRNGLSHIPRKGGDELFHIARSLGAKADKLRNQLAKLGNQAATQTGKKAATALKKMAKKAKLTVEPGAKHQRVVDDSGNLVTMIPHSPHAKDTIKGIAEAIMNAAGF